MNHKTAAGILGLTVAGLAAAYAFTRKNNRLMGRIDTEKSLTVARIPVALSLLWSSIAKDGKIAKRTLTSVGLSYIGMAIGSLFDKRLGGTLQKGFSKSDTLFHLASGIGALALSMIPEKKVPKTVPVTTK
jgi:hypothetical protein